MSPDIIIKKNKIKCYDGITEAMPLNLENVCIQMCWVGHVVQVLGPDTTCPIAHRFEEATR